MRLRFLRLTLIAPALLLLFMVSAGTAGAASGPRASVLYATPRHSVVPVKATTLNTTGSGTHYLYVDDGTCPDSIDVYKTGSTLTHVGNYPNDGCTTIAYYGSSTLAIAKASSAHGNCLLYGDSSGYVDSFSLNSDGSIGTEVSHLLTHSGIGPSYVAYSAKSNTAYEANPGGDLESYSVGSGCALTYLQSQAATSQFYISFALDGNRLIVPDLYSGNIDTYTLGSGGSFTYLTSVAGQIASPDSVALQTIKLKTGKTVTRVYTGQATANAPQVQAGKYVKKTGAVKFESGSPASDPNGSNGAAVAIDSAHNILIQGEQYTDALANYNVKGGKISFMSETPLAVGGEAPSNFVQLKSTLFVDAIYNGDLEACSLTASGASGCASVAVLTSTASLSTGMAMM